jgi:hypothetical protein
MHTIPSETSVGDDVHEIMNLVNESHFLVDSGKWTELVQTVFAKEIGEIVPEASFGFATWRGRTELEAGFNANMPRFEAAAHVVSNMHISVAASNATARYYVQGWHWFADGSSIERDHERNADFMVLGIMTDELVRQEGEWRILRRELKRLGPGMAIGATQPWLRDLGASG